MTSSAFPDFVRKLPEADLPFDGLRGWLLQSDSGLLMFNEADVELTVAEHTHGDQWGVVLDGTIDLTVNGILQTFRRGDTYFIRSSSPHSARIYPGFRALDYFADRDRYRARSHDAR